jgi:hypothetical protein
VWFIPTGRWSCTRDDIRNLCGIAELDGRVVVGAEQLMAPKAESRVVGVGPADCRQIISFRDVIRYRAHEENFEGGCGYDVLIRHQNKSSPNTAETNDLLPILAS